MPDLSLQTVAKRLRIYIGESDRWRSKPLATALLETFRQQGIAGATVFRGIAGFGAHSRIHTHNIEVLSFDLPIVIEIVDTPEKIASITDLIYPMVREGLITIEDTQIIKYTHRYLNPLPADRLISEVMTKNIVTLSPDMPISLAWKMMLENKVKAIPVVDHEKKVTGIVTDEDLLERAGIRQRLSIALRLDQSEINQEIQSLINSPLKVTDIMSQPVITIQATETLGRATSKMVKTGLKRLPVVNENGVLVGILSRLDVLRQVANSPYAITTSNIPVGAAKTIGEIMTSNIPIVNQDDNLATIVDKFSKTDSHRLIVINSDGKAIGLISDSDVVARVQPAKRPGILAAFRRIGKTPAGNETALELMSAGLLTAPPDLSVAEATQRMLTESRKWLVVVNEENHPIGLVDRQLLLEAVMIIHQPDREE